MDVFNNTLSDVILFDIFDTISPVVVSDCNIYSNKISNSENYDQSIFKIIKANLKLSNVNISQHRV